MKKLLNLVGLATLTVASCTATAAAPTGVHGQINSPVAQGLVTTGAAFRGDADTAGTALASDANLKKLQQAESDLFGNVTKVFDFAVTNASLAGDGGKIVVDNLLSKDGTGADGGAITTLRGTAVTGDATAKGAFALAYNYTIKWALNQTALPNDPATTDNGEKAENALVQAALDYKAAKAAAGIDVTKLNAFNLDLGKVAAAIDEDATDQEAGQ